MGFRTHQSGFWLVGIGLLGVLFFWLTDQRYGLAGPVTVEQANMNLPGTLIGVVGSMVVLCVGLWLMTRRTA